MVQGRAAVSVGCLISVQDAAAGVRRQRALVPIDRGRWSRPDGPAASDDTAASDFFHGPPLSGTMRGLDETARYPIRTATADNVRAFLAPLVIAFGEELTDAEFDDWRRTIEPERLIAAFDGDAPIAAAGAFTFRLTVPGGEVGAAGVTAVGVEPGHRRQGVLRSLMRHQLDDVRSRGSGCAWSTCRRRSRRAATGRPGHWCSRSATPSARGTPGGGD
jgi:GNAT superfamily N-acetyltransferase